MQKIRVSQVFANGLACEPGVMSAQMAFEGNIQPPPTNAETLRFMADSIKPSDNPDGMILAAILRSAARELDAQKEALKLAVGTLVFRGHDDEAKQVVAESRKWKESGDAPQNAG